MNSQIKEFVSACDICNAFKIRNQKETLVPHSIREYPWAKVGADIFDFEEESYLIMVDYYSDWIEYDWMKNQTAEEVTELMRKQFSRWGNPEELITDSGSNFNSEHFANFCREKNTTHKLSSPHHHQSNGKAESAVKVVKNLLRKSRKSSIHPCDALMDQRQTPTAGMNTSPARRFLSRQVRTELPIKASLLKPKLVKKVLEQKEMKIAKFKTYYDQRAKDLPSLKQGDTVRVSPEGVKKGQEWKKGTVIKQTNPRAYDVLVKGKLLKPCAAVQNN